MASLAELRAAAGTSKRLPTRSYELCLAQDLVAKVKQLSDEHTELVLEIGGDVEPDEAPADGTDQPKKPSRIGDPRRTRLLEIKAELKKLAEEMREHSGRLFLQGISPGEWMLWVEANPPRESGRDDMGRPILNAVDDRVAYGFCDAQALADDLFRYVATWNDEPVTEEDWEYLVGNAAPGDITELVKIVVQMHEAVGARAPKFSSISSPTTGTAATS